MAAGGQEIGLHPGEELLDRHQPPFQEEVEVAGLRHSGTVGRPLRQAVALDQGDAVEMVGEHACREHASNASPHHDGVAAGTCLTFLPMLR